MKQKFTFILVMMCLFSISTYAQILFWSDNFEDFGAPSSGIRTLSIAEFSCGGPPATAYFKRTNLAGIALQSGTYSLFEGSTFFAAEDIDKGPTCINNSISANQQVTWSSINITGKSGLSFKGLFACNNFNGGYQGTDWGSTQDFMAIEYRIDGGSWTKAIGIYSNDPYSSNVFSVDTNGDLLGDGTALYYAFTELEAPISGTGTTLDIRFNCHVNATGTQEIAVDNFRLFETPACTPPTITANPPNRAICVGSNTTFTITATGATSYQWQVNTGSGFTDIPNGGVYANVTTNNLTITGATAAMNGYLYRCKAINGVYDCSSNSNAATLSISDITASTAKNDAICFGSATGSASVSPSGGIGSYTYSWSPSGGTGSIATGLSAGSYTCTITDAISCQITKTITINQPTAISLTQSSQTNVSCNGGSNGAASVNAATGGVGGYTYDWTPGNPTGDGTTSVTGLTPGTWTCTVTDANSCTSSVNFTITQPTALNVTAGSKTDVSCNGGSNGTATVSPTGGTAPYTYSWVPFGGTNATATGLSAGTYTVIVTDANSCQTTRNFTITQPTALNVTAGGKTDVSCNGGSNGTATVTPAGGTAPYTYSWSPFGGTGATATGLSAGFYTVTVTDANSCETTRNFTITQPTALNVTTGSKTDVSCNGGSNGTATVTPTGGTAPYTYSWSPFGGTGATATGLPVGTYTVTVTDANFCQTTRNFTIIQPTAISLTKNLQTNVACNGGSNGAATVNAATGGAGGYTYDWTPGNPAGDGTTSVTGLTPGTWTCTVTDANSCTASINFTVTQPTAISLTKASQTNVSIFGGSNGAATVNAATGGAGFYTYDWTPGNPSGDGTTSVTGLTAGTWTCTVTDANACTASESFLIISSPEVSTTTATFISTTSATLGGNVTADGDATVTERGVVYSKTSENADPVIGGSNVTQNSIGDGTGVFSESVSELIPNSNYSVKAYAINSAGTSYGDIITFTTLANGTFTGSVNNDWATAENWAGGSVPTSATDVIIPSGKTAFISASTFADCNNINIDPAGSLTIHSDATRAGSLIVSGTATGNVTYQSYLAETGKWYMVAAPVAEQNLWGFATLSGNSIAEKTGKRAVTEYVEGTNTWDTNYPTADTEGSFSAGSGYSMLRSEAGVVSYTGSINTTDVSKALTRNLYGWNALGNPYTSAINANETAHATNNLITANASNFDPIFAALYIWDAASSQYVTINNTGTGTLEQNHIQAGQGFFVRAKDNSGLIFSITEAMQTHQQAIREKSGETTWPTIELAASGKEKLSKTVVTFNHNMTTGLDVTYDAGMFKADKNFALYTKLVDDNGVDFAIQALPDNRFNELVIPLGIDVPDGTEITFSAEAVNLPADAAVYLEDKATKTMTQLDVAGANYMVTITEKTKGAGNFFLHTSSATTTASELENNLLVYTSDRAIYIKGNINSNDIIALYGVDGKLHYRKIAEKSGLLRIDASKMPAGVYLISIEQNTGRVTRKVVISE